MSVINYPSAPESSTPVTSSGAMWIDLGTASSPVIAAETHADGLTYQITAEAPLIRRLLWLLASPDERAFLNRLAEAPNDMTTLGAYADLLAEQGDVGGEQEIRARMKTLT